MKDGSECRETLGTYFDNGERDRLRLLDLSFESDRELRPLKFKVIHQS